MLSKTHLSNRPRIVNFLKAKNYFFHRYPAAIKLVCVWLLTAIALPGIARSAQITFTEAYTGTISLTGGTGLQSNNIDAIVDLGASSYRLESIPASSTSFAATTSGNNVDSKLYYTAGGVDYVITGKVSRQDKSGSTPISFYFY